MPGTYAPGGANTPFMPVRALGAPHTTCTGSPDPVSTRHTFSLSASGCLSAFSTWATVNGFSASDGSVTASTSRPTANSASTTCSRLASVSR